MLRPMPICSGRKVWPAASAFVPALLIESVHPVEHVEDGGAGVDLMAGVKQRRVAHVFVDCALAVDGVRQRRQEASQRKQSPLRWTFGAGLEWRNFREA